MQLSFDPNPKEQIKILQELLPEAEQKARNAKEVTLTDGYKNYMDWVKAATEVKRPNITTLDGLIAFMAGQLVNAGVAWGATYFESIQNDPKQIKKGLEDLKEEYKADLEDWDIDEDADNS